MKVKVTNLDASTGGDIELRDDVFGLEPRADILHRVVTWQLEKRRGTARAARERSDVARTGKKFGRQKGGGTARHGDRRAPIFVGGEQLGNLGLGKTALVIDGDALNVGFAMASSNLREINLLPAVGANVYDILKADTLVLTRAAVEKLEARF
jgi:large subunit ribosomal protein L4